MKSRLNMPIDEETYKTLKLLALIDNKNIGDVGSKIIREYLEAEKPDLLDQVKKYKEVSK